MKPKIKEEVEFKIEQLVTSFQIHQSIVRLESELKANIPDLAISKTAKAIFDELEKSEMMDFEVHEKCTVEEPFHKDCPQCKYEELKKKYCDDVVAKQPTSEQ